MHDLSYSSFDSGDMPHFEKGSLIKLENGDCKKVEELSRDDFEKVTYCSKVKRDLVQKLLQSIGLSIRNSPQNTVSNNSFIVQLILS